ncbi:MAG: hypothetical protein EXQ52_17995 [Bryobacterales bacterium]|nr:hypothetical protein [Bryobacterales bacterium]
MVACVAGRSASTDLAAGIVVGGSAARNEGCPLAATLSLGRAMNITVEIAEELARRVIAEGPDAAREVLEAIALQGYRRDRLSEADIREPLDFEARIEVQGFLKEHGTHRYTYEDLEHDRLAAGQVASGAPAEHPSDSSGRNAGN